MTTPREEQPRSAEVPVPTVTTAPPRSRWRAGWLPVHLGRARTSTVVLALLWLAVFTLYVFVRPPSATPETTGTTQQQVDPGRASTRTSRPAPTTTAPATTAPATTAPATTAPATTMPEDTTPAPRTTAPSTPSTTPGGATTTPTTAGSTSAAPTTAPPGSATEQVPVPTPGATTGPGPAAPTS